MTIFSARLKLIHRYIFVGNLNAGRRSTATSLHQLFVLFNIKMLGYGALSISHQA
ncbi:hypothetical protein [Calothrix sp. CCY 0018]|uniref:hypothetical protein n=1 Tax=Calothrix sp. CCY 0018 TaxID=3103864 RepID=UPI0039C61483